jgi:hypothetical protein
MTMHRKRSETDQDYLVRLEAAVLQLEAEAKALRTKTRLFTPTEWTARERQHTLNQVRNDARRQRADAGQEWSAANGYPDLQGSLKQVRWAVAIRQQLVTQFRQEQPVIAGQIELALKEKTDAVWWVVRAPRTGSAFSATKLLTEDAVNDNLWSGEKTLCPGVAIPVAPTAMSTWVN